MRLGGGGGGGGPKRPLFDPFWGFGVFPCKVRSFSPKDFIHLETVYTIRRSDKMLLIFKEIHESLNPAALLQVEEGNMGPFMVFGD